MVGEEKKKDKVGEEMEGWRSWNGRRRRRRREEKVEEEEKDRVEKKERWRSSRR